MFDKNGNGTISFDELRDNLQGNDQDDDGCMDEIFRELIKEVDMDGNGEIDFKEFEKMMTIIVRSRVDVLKDDISMLAQ